MGMNRNTWKLQDAKAQFSELVRRARAGEPQQVTVHGKQAVVVLDANRFEFRPKPSKEATRESIPLRDTSGFADSSPGA